MLVTIHIWFTIMLAFVCHPPNCELLSCVFLLLSKKPARYTLLLTKYDQQVCNECLVCDILTPTKMRLQDLPTSKMQCEGGFLKPLSFLSIIQNHTPQFPQYKDKTQIAVMVRVRSESCHLPSHLWWCTGGGIISAWIQVPSKIHGDSFIFSLSSW